ncbi:MAG: A/G-specific adenine glycosylase [Tissierellia bacterium]|nr:A/G-specific adenine glycosylase [Tissierellia bacterium]
MSFSKRLLQFYRQKARSLPWRRDRDPYKIWLSEIMLQQTRVVTVVEYFHRFLEKYPTVEDLAASQEDEVLKLWQGLGYYSRARNMRRAAQVIVADYGGQFPKSARELRKLPGIGPYTAGAIASIAFNEKVAAVDGNALRVMSRIHALEEDIAREKTRALVGRLMEEAMEEDYGAFNQALMDLGSEICTPKSPRCDSCPVRGDCRALEEGRVLDFPVKSTKKPPKREKYTVLVVEMDGDFLLQQRPDQGLLASLYTFPMVPGHLAEEDVLKLALEEDFIVEELLALEGRIHRFTHKIWDMRAYYLRALPFPHEEGRLWASRRELREIYAIPTAHMPFVEEVSKDEF